MSCSAGQFWPKTAKGRWVGSVEKVPPLTSSMMPNMYFNVPWGKQAHFTHQIKETERDLKENRDQWQSGTDERLHTHFCSSGMADNYETAGRNLGQSHLQPQGSSEKETEMKIFAGTRVTMQVLPGWGRHFSGRHCSAFFPLAPFPPPQGVFLV